GVAANLGDADACGLFATDIAADMGDLHVAAAVQAYVAADMGDRYITAVVQAHVAADVVDRDAVDGVDTDVAADSVAAHAGVGGALQCEVAADVAELHALADRVEAGIAADGAELGDGDVAQR